VTWIASGKSKKGWIIGGSIAGGVLLVLVIIAVTRLGGASSVGTVGQSVRDGNLEYTVTRTRVGTDFGNAWPRAGNELFVASVTVKNIGKKFESVSAVDQVAASATKHYNGFAFATDDSSGLLDTEGVVLKPGSTISLEIPWNVPVGTKVLYLELHGGDSSGGARVNLK